jgi:hypothetical protein
MMEARRRPVGMARTSSAQPIDPMSDIFQLATVAKTILRQHPTSNIGRTSRARRDVMNRKTSVIVAVLLACPVPAAQPAKAQVVDIATGIAGGLVDGVLFGSRLLASNPMPPHRTFGEPPIRSSSNWTSAAEPSDCRMQRVHFWDGYGWRYRHTEVCD